MERYDALAVSAHKGAPVTVVIVEDAFLVREGLRQLLELSAAVEVVATCPDAQAALTVIEAKRPDVVISDIRMPPEWTDEGLRLAEQLRVEHPATGVILLSQEGRADVAASLLRDGAAGRGYLLKERVHDVSHVESTVLAVARGECRIDPELVQRLVRPHSGTKLQNLTPRQLEILGDIAEGKSNAAIARDRFLSQRAVEKHISELFSRLGLAGDPDVSRRVRATLIFLDESP